MKDEKGNWRLPVEPARPGAAPVGGQLQRGYVRVPGGVVTLDGAPLVSIPGIELSVYKDGELKPLKA